MAHDQISKEIIKTMLMALAITGCFISCQHDGENEAKSVSHNESQSSDAVTTATTQSNTMNSNYDPSNGISLEGGVRVQVKQ